MNRRAYLSELLSIVQSVPADKQASFLQSFQEREKNPVIAFGFNTCLGYLGADRFYLGQPLWGVVKLLTVGGFGIWIIVDYFIIAGLAREKSIAFARQLKSSMAPIR